MGTMLKNTWMVGRILAAALVVAPVQAIELGVFGDVGFTASDDNNDPDNFGVGGLDLYANEQIDANTKAFFEVVYEHDGEQFVLDVERYQITRRFTDAFNLGVGRFHAPLGYWNRNFHHGVLIQDTASRPAFLDFEDGDAAILPMHTVGLMATGKLAPGLGYELTVGNGSGYSTERASSASPGSALGEGEILIANTEDFGDDKTIIGRLTYGGTRDVPVSVGLFAGSFSLMEAGSQTAAQNDSGVAKQNTITTTTVFGIDARYEIGGFDALAEYYNLDSDPESGVAAAISDGSSHSADAYYIQLGYHITEPFKALYRFESLSFDAGTDAYFNVLGVDEYEANVFALRYELDDSNALYLEVNSTDFGSAAANDTTTTTLNWAFLMF